MKPSSPRFHLLWKGIDQLLVVLMVLMIILVFVNVVLRYGFDSGMRSSIELSRLGFVWLVMLGAINVLRCNEHLALTEFSEKLLPRWVPLLQRLVYVVIAAAMAMFFWGSYQQMNANWHNLSTITGLPSALNYLAGVVSSLLCGAIAVVRMIYPQAFVEKAAV